MDEQNRAIAGAALVALAGGMMAFLLLTDRGRDALRRVGPALDDVSRTLEEVRSIVRKIDDVVQEAQVTIADVRAAFSSMSTPDDPQDSPYGV